MCLLRNTFHADTVKNASSPGQATVRELVFLDQHVMVCSFLPRV